MSDPATTYSRLVRVLHWTTLLLMIAVYATAELRGFAPDRPARIAVMQWHMALGLAIVLLVLPRIGARLMQPVPAIVPPPGRLVAIAAKVTHVALYVFLIVQPLLGLVTAQSGERAVVIPLTGITLPDLIPNDHDLHEWTEEIHVLLGKIFYAVIGLHAAAAIAHHYWFRDNTLRRMLG
ncbi:MAG TPA: cytochrome b [Tahibacter sp.]|uniref:cytochrome b n=1 Tax=Tahibacter sp. TaxID=2056211 RepID=UPI002C32E43D|nr:cytochrome b [Tahibacter sp.]HSX62120.1 cytochrome b [Tahibacter sp.]